jgi:hypothetical protein
MAKDTFVDRKLVNIRGKLMDEAKDSSSTVSNSKTVEPVRRRSRTQTAESVNINDKEWKKAVFQRWDEFKALKRDVLLKLNGTLSSIPDDITSAEKRIAELKSAEQKLQVLLSDIEMLDDSSWDRHNLASELSSAMRKVENARLESMIISAKFADKQSGGTQSPQGQNSSIIHEIQSLSFSQTFKLGLGFFFPLIIAVIVAVLILSLFNYLTLM